MDDDQLMIGPTQMPFVRKQVENLEPSKKRALHAWIEPYFETSESPLTPTGYRIQGLRIEELDNNGIETGKVIYRCGPIYTRDGDQKRYRDLGSITKDFAKMFKDETSAPIRLRLNVNAWYQNEWYLGG